jgi:hypothetical protein
LSLGLMEKNVVGTQTYPEFNQEDVAAQYRAEKRYLEQLPADQVVYYLNDQPTTAEERLNAVVDIIAGKFY